MDGWPSKSVLGWIFNDPEQKSKRSLDLRYPLGVWNPSTIVATARESLQRCEDAFRAQQSTRGLDALLETQIHPILSQGLSDTRLGVHCEVPYPSSTQFTPKNSARQRCDLVVTEQSDTELFDPIAEQKILEMASGTLFAELAHDIAPEKTGADPSECYWIEVKSIAQYAYVDGVPAPNGAYARQLTQGPVEDIAKLAAEPAIWHAGMMVILFAESETVIERDIMQLAHECLNRDLPVGTPIIESLSITDRAGNTCCGVGLIPLRL